MSDNLRQYRAIRAALTQGYLPFPRNKNAALHYACSKSIRTGAGPLHYDRMSSA
jgi:hypothetical protein